MTETTKLDAPSGVDVDAIVSGGISLRMLRLLCDEAEKKGLHPDLVALEETTVAGNSVGDLALFLWRR